MDEIRQKIEEFESQLIPKPTLLKEIALNNPALLPAIGLIVGLVLQFYFKLPLFAYIIVLTVCTVLQIIQMLLKKVSISLTFAIVLFCFLSLGSIRLIEYNVLEPNDIRSIAAEDFTFAHIKTQIITKPVVVAADENDWLFSGFSQSLPYTTFYAKVAGIKTTDGWTNASGKIKFYISEDVNNLKLGNEFIAFCRLQKFYPPDNPGQFNTAAYMYRNGVYLSASVKTKDALKTEKPKSLFNIKTKFRELAIAALLDDTEENNNMHLVEALVLGSRTKINRKLYDDFIKTGLVHLVALSGLNVGILAGFFWWLAKKTGLLHQGRSIACIIATILFLLVVPSTSSTLRAGIMFIVFCLGRMFNRRSSNLNNLAVSAIFLLLIKPLDFLNPGFQLSFAAVLGIVLFYEPICNFLILPAQPLRETPFYPPLRMPLDMFAVGLAAWIAVVPIVAWHFYQFQLFTALWTVPASVPVAVILILGTFKILLNPLLPTLSGGLAYIIDFSAWGLSELVTVFAKVPFSNVITGKPSIYIVLLFYLLLFLWKFFPFKRPVRNFIYPAIIILLLISAVFLNKFEKFNNLRLTVLSVGHGQAVVGQLPGGRNIIIDAGSMSKNDPGNRIINPFLNYIAAEKIDSIFISHDDIDHYNGLPEILKQHKCKNVYTTLQFIQSAATSTTDAILSEFIKSKNLSLCPAPEKILWRKPSHSGLGKTAITLLWPKTPLSGDVLSDNESSLVILLEYAGRKILFCSDITEEVQNQLINSNPQLDIDVMLTPHHGSARTTDAAFLSHFKPEFLITSCSAARLSSVSEEIKAFEQSYYTPKDGAVTVTITPTGKIKVKTFKMR